MTDSVKHLPVAAARDVEIVLLAGPIRLFEIASEDGPFSYEVTSGNGLVTFSTARTAPLAARADRIDEWRLERDDDGRWYYALETAAHAQNPRDTATSRAAGGHHGAEGSLSRLFAQMMVSPYTVATRTASRISLGAHHMPARWNALFDRNLMDAIREFCRWQDGTLMIEEDGMLLVSGGTEFPIGFSNCVARTDPDTDPATVIERGEEFFRAQGRGFTVWVREHVDADIDAYLQQRGLRPTGQSPWMFLTKHPQPAALPDGVDVRITSAAADLPMIRSIIADAFGPTGTPLEETDSLFAHQRRVFSPVTRFALATVDGEPAATAMVLLTGGMGGIYWVGTRPRFARRGLGTLCTVAVANAAFELGKPVVGLHSTPMGQAVYERLGFEHVPSGHHWYVLT